MQHRERVNLATKIVQISEADRKTQKSNKWFQQMTEEAGLEMDDDLLDEGLIGGDERDRSRVLEAHKARDRLRQLLSEPMQTQRYGKFLSTNTSARQQMIVPPVLPSSSSEKKRRRLRE